MKLRLGSGVFVVLFLILLLPSLYVVVKIPYAYALPSWPSSWIEIDWDGNENGPIDDWRDVHYAYYEYDSGYLYLKLQCYDLPGKQWSNNKDGRYKWFIDLDGNMYYSGGNIIDAEYLLFVEDTDHNGVGEMYLVFDTNNDNNFGEYEPWPPANYANYKILDPNIGGWRIVAPNQIEMYIRWASIGNPSSYWLFWSTDQQNSNLDQAPATDRVDEERPIAVHNVAAISQTPTPTIVNQGEHVTIQVVVENKGTQKETFNVTCYYNNTVIGTQLVTNLAAGRKTTLTFDWDTTGLPAGNYSITSWADSSSVITESNECDNWCTSPTIVTIQVAPVHDVAAISQVPDNSSVVQGTIVNINVTVSNLGDFSETFNVTCFYGENPISYQTVTNLPSKTSTYMIFAWNTTEVEPNTYYIKAWADSNNVISEINENNNNCTSFQPVTVRSIELGRLFVDKVKTAVISGEDPPVVGLPTVYELTIIVTNIGGSDVSNIIVNETISSDVSFVSVGTPSQGSITALPPPKIVWSVGTLTPGASATLTFRIRVTPPSLDLIYLNHKEDIVATGKDVLGNTVSDTGDTDVTVTPIIRDVAAVSQTPTSTIICQGDTITINVVVKNFGNVSETFNVTCYYDTNLIGVVRVYNLAAGSQTTIPFAWDTTGITPGTYSIGAEADSSNEVAESDETNNVCTSPTTVKIVIHDITIISQVPSPTTVEQGENVTIQVVVKNEGTEPETFTVSCYYNDTHLETKTVTNLAPNTQTTLNFMWNTTGVEVGTYYINTEASTVPGEKDTDDNACRSVNMVTVILPQYALTITTTAGGTTDPTPETYTHSAGTTVEVTAEQYVDYRFDHWVFDGSPAGSVNPIEVLMNKSHTLEAVFVETHTLIITVTTGGTTNPVPGTHYYDVPTRVTVTAIPYNNYRFDHWEYDGINIGSDNPVTVDVGSSHTLHAVFTLITYTLKIEIAEGGTTNPPPGTYTYTNGTRVYVNAIADPSYRFDHWILDGSSGGSANPISVLMDRNHTLKAVFEYVPGFGGYSISLVKQAPMSHIAAYTMLIALFCAVLSLTKRKRK